MEYKKNIPLYIQVKDDLYNKINNKEFDDMLPSENELCVIYNVSRVTLRKALEKLEKDKVIIRRAGFGTSINHNINELKNFTLVKSFTNEMKETGTKNISTFSSTMSISFANQNMMKIFKCSDSKKVYNLKRLRGSNNKPIVYSDTWLCLDVDLPTSKEFLFGSLYDYLANHNILFERFEEELEAMMPNTELREILNIDKDSAILKRVRKGYDVNNKLIEYTVNYYDSKLYCYSVEVASIERVR